MRHALFPADEIAPGEIRRVEIGRVGIAILRTPAGDLHALRDVCSHMGARLSHGWLTPMIDGDDIDDRRVTDRIMIRCPWHGYEFDVHTGRCPADPQRVRTRSYPVSVEDGMVVLER